MSFATRVRCWVLGGLVAAAPWLCFAADAPALAHAATPSAPLLVRHNFFVSDESSQLNYKGEVLTLLLEKSKARFGPYVLEKGPQIGWSQNRTYRELELGHLDVISSMTNEPREASGLPIRYCLYKGLLGVRIGLGSKSSVKKFDAIASWDELKQVNMGLVFDWPDYAIQTGAGLKVLRLPALESSVARLKRGTYDLLPMGVVEVGPLAKKHDLSTISTWAIAYPTAYYFFVSKTRPELAQRLAYGFELALKDHSFDQLFAKRIGPLLADAELDKRQIFHIKNSYLPKETPLQRKELWHPLVFAARAADKK